LHIRSLILLELILVGLPICAWGDALADQDFQSIMRLKPNVSNGRNLFDTCTACHGSTGAGVSDGTVPAIAAQHFRVITTALVAFRRGSRKDPRMEHFTDEHHLSSEQAIADVAAYANQLQPTKSSDHGDGTHIGPGADIYKTNCSGCHGARAEGSDSKRYPRLAGQHYDYLLHQLRDATEQRPSLAHDHAHLLEQLNPSDLTGICDYLSRLGP
jgi:cytochrome c553